MPRWSRPTSATRWSRRLPEERTIDIASRSARRLAHLKVEGLTAGYGAFLVLRDLTLEARPGLTVILGPNGAGKTTLLKAIAGLIPRSGKLLLDGDEICADAKTHEIVAARRGAGARGPAAVPADDGAREPRARRLAGRPGRARAQRLEQVLRRTSRSSPSAPISWPAR